MMNLMNDLSEMVCSFDENFSLLPLPYLPPIATCTGKALKIDLLSGTSRSEE